MALNYSHRPVHAAHTSEDDFVKPMRMVNGCLMGSNVTENRGEGYLSPWHVSRGEADWNFNYGKDHIEKLTSGDIVDRLPSDPFGMDMKTTLSAITGWLEDLEADCGEYMRKNGGSSSHREYDIFAGWNFIWSNALEFPQFPSNGHCNTEKPIMGNQSFSEVIQAYDKLHLNPDATSKAHLYKADREVIGASLASHELVFQDLQYGVRFDYESTCCSSEQQFRGKLEGTSEYFEEGPHDALTFALGYLGVKDLLSVEKVCRSLCSTVRSDPLLWMNIHIGRPLNENINDDILVRLASRAQGNLQCLTLVECNKVTDNGLKRILETNSRMTKLSLSGCARLSMASLVNNMKIYHSRKEVRGIKKLRVASINGATNELYEELKVLLGVDKHKVVGAHNPNIYHGQLSYLPIEDDRVIDIETCPRCDVLRLVYDCPAEECRAKKKPSEMCRGCIICVQRCTKCGRCLEETEYVETFCLESVCLDCFNYVGPTSPKCSSSKDDGNLS